MIRLASFATLLALAAPDLAQAQPKLALITDDPALSLSFDAINHLRATAAELGYEIQVAAHGGDVALESRLLEEAITSKVAGILLVPADDQASATAVRLAGASGRPVVVISRPLVPGVATAQYLSNHGACASEAAQLMIQLTGKRGLFLEIYGPGGDPVATARRQAVDAAFLAKPGQERGARFISTWSQDSNYQLVFDFLRSGNEISGILASNDDQTLGALAALEAQTEPADIQIGGIGGSFPVTEAVKSNRLSFTMLEPIRAITEGALAEIDRAIRGEPRSGPEVIALSCSPYLSEAARTRLSGNLVSSPS